MKRELTGILLLSTALYFGGACGGGKDQPFWLLAGLTTQEEAAVTTGDAPETTTTTGDSGGTTVTVTSGDVVDTSTDFSFETTKDVDVDVTVSDSSGAVSGAVVQIIEITDSGGNTLFQSTTGSDGKATGTVTVLTSTETIKLKIIVGDQETEVEVAVSQLAAIVRQFTLEGTATASTQPDDDADTIPNPVDAYPNDATRASTSSYGPFLAAYEDLYPSKGDYDFNDYVVRIDQEVDMDADGKVVRIRGTYTHMARGAGYSHKLYLTLPVSTGATVNLKRYAYDGSVESETTDAVASVSGYELMPSSNTTIQQSNTSSSQTFAEGKKAEVEITFDSPVSASDLGSAPYNLYIYINNTSQYVYLPGKVFNGDGSDKYLDSSGFPWAVVVPYPWAWPLERENMEGSYDFYDDWYLSSGKSNTDWYESPNENKVFVYWTSSSLGGFLLAGIQKSPAFQLLLGLLIVGLAGIAVLTAARRRSA